MSAIEKELLAVSKIKPKKGEERQAYLARLMKAVSKIKDPEWEALSSEAQDWNNDAAEAFKAGDELKDFPDLEAAPPPDEEEEEKEDEAPAKSKTVKVGGKRSSACHTIKTMVAKNPSISVSELSEKLKANNLKVSDVTIATLRSDTRDTLRVLNDLKLGSFNL